MDLESLAATWRAQAADLQRRATGPNTGEAGIRMAERAAGLRNCAHDLERLLAHTTQRATPATNRDAGKVPDEMDVDGRGETPRAEGVLSSRPEGSE